MTPTTVKLSQLLPDPSINSRISGYEDEIGQLADNIKAIGLILPIAVRPSGSHFMIIDGHRRHQALTMIHSDREDPDVPVLVRDTDDKDARVLSLAANIMRLPLHPADQFEAFKAMLDEGLTRQEIATRFSLSIKDVDKRLALGRVIKPFLDAFRKDVLDLDDMKALSAAAGERQLEIYKSLDPHKTGSWGWQIRSALNDKAIFDNDPRVRFVGLARYEEARGRVERSLFSDAVRLLDGDLLNKLCEEHVPAVIEEYMAEGWSFVAREHELPKSYTNWPRVWPDEQFASPEDEDRYNKIEELLENAHDDDDIDALQAEADLIDRNKVKGYSVEDKAKAGIIIYSDYRLGYGFVQPKAVESKADEPEKKEEKGWPAVLVGELESYATATAQLAIMREPDLADCMMIAAMYQNATPDRADKMLALHDTDRFMDVNVTTAGAEAGRLIKSFGIKGNAFWNVLAQVKQLTPEKRMALRAALVSRMLRKLEVRTAKPMFEALETADLFEVWKPEAEFFARLSLAQLSEIHKELTGHGLSDMKKKDAVQIVATKAAAANWVPDWMRPAMKKGSVVQMKPKKRKAA